MSVYLRSYRLWQPNCGETRRDSRIVRDVDAEDAAEEFAEKDDRESADYTFVRNGGGEVTMQRCTRNGAYVLGPPFVVHLEVETVPVYRALRAPAKPR